MLLTAQLCEKKCCKMTPSEHQQVSHRLKFVNGIITKNSEI